jgi:hypothetical protein
VHAPARQPFDFGASLRFIETSRLRANAHRRRLLELAGHYGTWQGYWGHYLRVGG